MLIECKECKHEVSSFADACPSCGMPVKLMLAPSTDQTLQRKKTRRTASQKRGNKTGSISKVTGRNLRKPWKVVVTTTSKKVVEKNIDGQIRPTYKQERKVLGYYRTKDEATVALANYNETPFDIHKSHMSFAEAYEMWSKKHFPTISGSNVKGYEASFKAVSAIHDKELASISIQDLESIFENTDKNFPTMKKMKILINQVFAWAVKYNAIKVNPAEVLDISKFKERNPNKKSHSSFTSEQIETLWNHLPNNELIEIVLAMIYTGVRINELLNLKVKDVNMEEHYFNVVQSKTDAGIRSVPIANKVYPFFEKWIAKGNEYLLTAPNGKHYVYRNFKDAYWNPIMNDLSLFDYQGELHRPHDTRHTCQSMLATAGIDQRIINTIVGHQGKTISEQVYVHFEMETLLDAINKI